MLVEFFQKKVFLNSLFDFHWFLNGLGVLNVNEVCSERWGIISYFIYVKNRTLIFNFFTIE